MNLMGFRYSEPLPLVSDLLRNIAAGEGKPSTAKPLQSDTATTKRGARRNAATDTKKPASSFGMEPLLACSMPSVRLERLIGLEWHSPPSGR
jgi:hypothetical protein